MSLDKLTKKTSEPNPAPTRKPSLAWLLPVALLIGFLCIIILLFGKRLLPALEVQTAPVITLRLKLESQEVKSGDPVNPPTQSRMIFQASGWIEPDPYITYVPSLISGVVDTVNVLDGQYIKKGDLLATLIDDDAELNLREAKQKITTLNAKISAHCTGSDIAGADLLAANKKIDSLKARLAESADNLTRLESIPAGAVPKQQVVQARLAKTQHAALLAEAETAIPRIRARLEQIEFERIAMNASLSELQTAHERAQLAMDRTRIKAPMDGIILHLHAAPGKKRMLDMDDPKSAVIVELYDPNKLQARIDVPLTEASGLRIGQIVELISDLLPDKTFKGKVTRITGEADLQRNTLQAKISIENPDHRLRPEMLVRCKFFDSGSPNKSANESSARSTRLALYVPATAIVNGTSIWVVSPKNTAELRTIKLGNESRDAHRRILEGLKSGEQVILPPHTNIKNGSRVKPQISKIK